MSGPDAHIVVRGRMRTIEYAVRADGSMPAKAFLDSLSQRDRANLMALFTHVAENGEEHLSKGVFRREKKPFYAFKRKSNLGPEGGKGLIRIPCFRVEQRVILTHGFWKPLKPKWPEEECRLTEAVYAEVMSRETKKKNK